MQRVYCFLLIVFTGISQLKAQTDTVYVFGPGGPFPPMKEVAEKFESLYPVKIVIQKGPLSNWKEEAGSKADLIYSGSEHMMSDFERVFANQMLPESVYPLYFRHSGLIVRKGNPKKIKSCKDLQETDIRIMVVNGSGLTGVWEDMFGNLKDKSQFRNIRKNIVSVAANSGEAEKLWRENQDLNVWISWNIWQLKNTETSDFVSLPKKYTVYRDCGMALTRKGKQNQYATLFYNYLKSTEVKAVFTKWGWR